MPNYLTLDDGSKLNFLDKDPLIYFNKVNLFYGESGFGKGKLIEEAMFLLKDMIPVWFVVSPTNSQNRQYTNKLDSVFIKTEISVEFIELLYKRQMDAGEVYAQANQIQVLAELFKKCSDALTANKVDQIKKATARQVVATNKNRSLDPSAKKAHLEAIRKTEHKYLTEIYKAAIRFNRDKLERRSDLSPEEKTSIKFLDLNPNIGIIFDDCAAEVKKWGKAEVTKKLFYQSRHCHTTSFWAFQDDHDITPPLRKNGRNNFFTTPECATSYFSTKTNSQSATTRKRATLAIEKCFKQDLPVEHYRKLVYIKGISDPLQYTVADEYDEFKLGGKSSWDFAKSIPRKSTSEVSKKNPYMHKYIFTD